MSFRVLYKDICSPERIGATKKVCKIDEDKIRNNQWWTKEEPYSIKSNTYHVPSIFSIGKKTFPAKNLTPENRVATLEAFEAYAYIIMMDNYEIPAHRIVSATAIDIYAEPVSCYPLKVLIEVIVDVD